MTRVITGLFFAFWLIRGSVFAQSVAPVVGGISATPTKPTPRSAFWNPALLGVSSRTQIDTNLTLIGGWMIYDRDGVDPNSGGRYDSAVVAAMAPNPFFSMSSPLGSKYFRFGYSTYIPGGVLAEFNPDGPQRYQLINGLNVPWHHQFTVVYRPSTDWSVGLSGIYSLGFLKSDLSIDLNRFMESVLNSDQVPKENAVLEAKARIPLSTAHGLGAALGIYYVPTYQFSFGLAMFSPIFYNFDTKLQLETPKSVSTFGSGLRALGVEETIDMNINVRTVVPPILHFGFSYQPYGYWQMEYFGRYAFNSIWRSMEVKVKSASIEQAKHFVRPGQDLSDHFLAGTVQSFHLWKRWKLGVNFTYSSSPVEDHQMAVSLADFDSLLSGVFLQYAFTRRWIIGIEYAHAFMLTRSASGTSTAGDPNDIFPPVSSDGVYKASSDRIGIMFNYAY